MKRDKKMQKQHKDIRLLPDEEKYEIYDKIGLDVKVKIKEHSSGFPAITIDYKDFHLLTDCLSVEEWWEERQTTKESEKKMKRYVREENNLIYDRLGRRYIDVKSQRLIGNTYYINPETEDEIVISREDIEEKL